MLRVNFSCDPELYQATRQAANAHREENVSRVIRRWLRAGAAAEGIRIDG